MSKAVTSAHVSEPKKPRIVIANILIIKARSHCDGKDILILVSLPLQSKLGIEPIWWWCHCHCRCCRHPCEHYQRNQYNPFFSVIIVVAVWTNLKETNKQVKLKTLPPVQKWLQIYICYYCSGKSNGTPGTRASLRDPMFFIFVPKN